MRMPDANDVAGGTLHDTLVQSVARWGERPAYAVPPMKGRAYHPDGKQYTWNEVLAGVDAMHRRYARAGYGHGHRVAILFHQRPEFFFHYFALNALGCSVVPINPDYRVDEIAYALDHSEARLALSIETRLEDVRAAARLATAAPAVAAFDDSNDPLPEASVKATLEKPGADTEAALLYTSGTTGKPKGCVLSNYYFHNFATWYLSRGGRLTMNPGEERMYNPLPLHHANCLSISTPSMLMIGGCLIFPDRFHPRSWWDDLVATEATSVHMQGIIPNLLLKLEPVPQEKKHRVRFGLCAGIEPSHHRAFEERFGFPVVEMWAMSETGRLITDNHDPRMVDTRAFGRETPGIESRIVDEHDRELPAGVPGEMVLRHSDTEPRRGFFSGYLKNEKATEEAWRGGWFHTGDTVVKDETGMHFFMDRKKNIIRRAGENIAAAEVEACLCAHPCVKQAAVIAVADEIREEEVMACIVAADGLAGDAALAENLLTWCLERMAYFKAPAWYLFVRELPTGTSQKVQKISLFPAGVDPRAQPGAVDLRERKKPARASAHAPGA